jgi:hypothetical protein
MEEYTKTELLTIMKAYMSLEKNMINSDLMDKAYDLLKIKSTINTPGSKVLAINRFVICNYQEILDMLSKPDDVPIPTQIIKTIEKVEKKLKPKPKKTIRKR